MPPFPSNRYVYTLHNLVPAPPNANFDSLYPVSLCATVIVREVACVASAKGRGEGGRKKKKRRGPPPPSPFFLSFPFAFALASQARGRGSGWPVGSAARHQFYVTGIWLCNLNLLSVCYYQLVSFKSFLFKTPGSLTHLY